VLGTPNGTTFIGGTGNDTMIGSFWNDTYIFNVGDGQDTIYDFDPNNAGTDVLQFGAGISADQLWFKQVNNNLEISVIGTDDKVTIAGWYDTPMLHIETIQLANGQKLFDSQVQNLVQAMASFAPPASGQTTLSTDYQNALEPVIASTWQ
jgi:Ca2+-binding RTX toxin-like protein